MSRPCALLAWALLALVGPRTVQNKETPACCGPIVPRSEWGARPSECTRPMSQPVRYVVISHTAGSKCDTPASCGQQAQNVQHYHVNSKRWCDVAYK